MVNGDYVNEWTRLLWPGPLHRWTVDELARALLCPHLQAIRECNARLQLYRRQVMFTTSGCRGRSGQL